MYNSRLDMKEYLWTASGFEPYGDSWKYGAIKAVLSSTLETESIRVEGVYQIEVPDEVIQLCREIEKVGGRALLVGGSVRDAIISAELPGYDLKPKDYDLEVYGIEPDDLMKILEINFVLSQENKFGKAFEVIKIKINGWKEPLDISIPRQDSKVGDGHGDFEITACPGMNIREAALRRDLKINSCAYDPLTRIMYDPYGGIEGIRNKVIEVTDKKSFQEDALRIYRIMQFVGRFDYTVSDETVALCREMVENGVIDKLSIDRISDEIKKFMIKSRKPSAGMEFALKIGLLEKYWPEAFALVGVPQEKSWHPEGDVWKHTMQVMDAAAMIADREKLDDTQRSILLWSALDHDLGKPVTTAISETGKIISHGHEEAGVEPAMNLFARFAKPGEPKTGINMEVRNAVAALVKDHLRPKEMWIDIVKKEQKLRGRIGRLARRLEKSGTSIYMLSLLAEADQRGRNGVENRPLERENVEELIEWQTWLWEKSKEQNVITAAPKMICRGETIKRLGGEMKSGPWIGAISECVFQDQMEGSVTNEDEATERAAYYFGILTERVRIVSRETERDERSIWEEIRMADDPRVYCVTV